jgi:uroporphyrinogen-III synthase
VELCFLLEDEGAEVLSLPLLERRPPANEAPLRAAAEHIHRYAWVAFASPAAVEALAEALRSAGTAARAKEVKVAVVGPMTARAARDHGLTVALEAVPPTGQGLLDTLGPQLAPGAEVLLPAASEGRTELAEGLMDLGANVTRVAAYEMEETGPDAAAWAALGSQVDAVLFGSPRTVDAFLDAPGDAVPKVLGRARLVAIGPTTAQALRDRGCEVAGVAAEPTPAGLLEALVRALQ